MNKQYFKMSFSRGGVETKLINPTYIYCSKELADKYGQALTICDELQGGHGNKFWFTEVDKIPLSNTKEILKPEAIREEIYYEFDRAYGYLSKTDEEYDRNSRIAQEKASKLIGDKLNKEIDSESTQYIR